MPNADEINVDKANALIDSTFLARVPRMIVDEAARREISPSGLSMDDIAALIWEAGRQDTRLCEKLADVLVGQKDYGAQGAIDMVRERVYASLTGGRVGRPAWEERV